MIQLSHKLIKYLHKPVVYCDQAFFLWTRARRFTEEKEEQVLRTYQ